VRSSGKVARRSPGRRSRHPGDINPVPLVYYHLLPLAVVQAVTDLPNPPNFRICSSRPSLSAASGMGRAVDTRLCEDFLYLLPRLRDPGWSAPRWGTLRDSGRHTLFFLVVRSWRVGGEGAIPLSVGYSRSHQNQGELFAQVLPSSCWKPDRDSARGALNMLGKKYPHLTGEGRYTGRSLPADADPDETPPEHPVWPT